MASTCRRRPPVHSPAPSTASMASRRSPDRRRTSSSSRPIIRSRKFTRAARAEARKAAGSALAAAAFLQQPPLLAVPVAVLLGLALVEGLLALTEPDQHLGHAALVEIELERHDGVALPLD